MSACSYPSENALREKLARFRSLCREGAPAIATDRVEAILGDEGDGHVR